MPKGTWKNEYQLLIKGHADKEPKRFRLRSDADVEPGHTFVLGDGNVAIVGEVDADTVWATYWFFSPSRDIAAEVTPAPGFDTFNEFITLVKASVEADRAANVDVPEWKPAPTLLAQENFGAPPDLIGIAPGLVESDEGMDLLAKKLAAELAALSPKRVGAILGGTLMSESGVVTGVIAGVIEAGNEWYEFASITSINGEPVLGEWTPSQDFPVGLASAIRDALAPS